MRKIKLTRGFVALVDDEDYEWLNQWKWYASSSRGKEYATRWTKEKTIFMHRIILEINDEQYHNLRGDHIDGDGLNNQRSNLRIVNRFQNQWNRLKIMSATSKYIGVTWKEKNKKWQAEIRRGEHREYLGLFINEQDAAKARDTAAIRLFGKYARLNFPTEKVTNHL